MDGYVSKLRSKLEGALQDRRFIHTHPGFGYRFQRGLHEMFTRSESATVSLVPVHRNMRVAGGKVRAKTTASHSPTVASEVTEDHSHWSLRSDHLAASS